MIVSHRHRYLYIAVPRVAARAIRQALTMQTDSMDWQQQNLFAERRLPIPGLAGKEHGHLSVREVRPHLPEELWRSYFKFAFVRDPFERFVDTCLSLDREGSATPAQARERMKRAIATPRFRLRPLARPQSEFLVDTDGVVAVDFVGRYETLQQSYDEACRLIGIESGGLVRRRRPDERPWQLYYDAELTELVGGFYREDLERFGYAAPEPPACGA